MIQLNHSLVAVLFMICWILEICSTNPYTSRLPLVQILRYSEPNM